MTSQVYAYLTIAGFKCTHEVVESLVGLPALPVKRIGESTQGGKRIIENSWSGAPPVSPGEEQPDFYLRAVLDHIAQRPKELQVFLLQHDAGINCVGHFQRVNGGFHMDSSLVARCSELRLWLDFDLYNYVTEDEP